MEKREEGRNAPFSDDGFNRFAGGKGKGKGKRRTVSKVEQMRLTF
jgi:hypothetical protein